MSLLQLLEEKFRAQTKDALQKIRDTGWQRFVELKSEVGSRKSEIEIEETLFLSSTSDFRLPTSDFSHIQFIDGKFVHSSVPAPAICIPLDEAMRSHSALLQHHLMSSLKAEKEPFAALNAALHERGAFLYIPPNCEMELSLSSNSSLWAFPRLQIFLGSSARLTLRNSATSSLSMIDCHLDRGAQLHLFDQTADRSVHHLRATLKRDSLLNAFTYSEGGSFCRSSMRAALTEEGSSARFTGLTALAGGRHSHFNVTVEHAAPNCTSHQHFKSLIGAGSLSQFTGNIFVRQIAQKTAAYQLSQNLLLDDSAKAHAIPNLEIFADDVKASHGATVSASSPEELFYLQARGISKKAAQRLLAESFAQEMADAHPAIQPRLTRYFETI